MKFCHNCGFELGDREGFCQNCGMDQVVSREVAPRSICNVCGASGFKNEMRQGADGRPVCTACFSQTGKFRKGDLTGNPRHRRDGQLASLHPRMAERVTFDFAYARIRKDEETLFGNLFGADQGKTGPILDLSITGLQCETELSVRQDDRVVLELKIKTLEYPLTVRGRIMWVEQVRPQRWRIGIQFEENDMQTRQELERLVRMTSSDLARMLESRQEAEPPQAEEESGAEESENRLLDF